MKIKSQFLIVLIIISTGSAIVLSLIFLVKPYWNNISNNNTADKDENRLETVNGSKDNIKDEEAEIKLSNLIDPDEYSDKVILAESEMYIVWIVNFVGSDGNFDGEYLITDKRIDSQYDSIKIEGTYNIFGLAEIAWENDEYVAVTNGTGLCRGGELISLVNQTVVTSFSRGGTVVDYEGYLYYEDCHVEQNRPWAGPASSIVKMELATGNLEVLFQADDLTQYSIEKVADGKLIVTKTFVYVERNWNDQSMSNNELIEFEL